MTAEDHPFIIAAVMTVVLWVVTGVLVWIALSNLESRYE